MHHLKVHRTLNCISNRFTFYSNLNKVNYIWKLFSGRFHAVLTLFDNNKLVENLRSHFGAFHAFVRGRERRMHLSDKPRSRGSRAVDEKRKVWMKSAPLKEIARTWLSENKPVHASISKMCMQVFLRCACKYF